ncbi:hypothetical protein LARV_01583 [Longilinea arvoryzae]|uniref:DUF3048 domain-containing protein n=1 Tax=Longilinea arvoryzae TaxID=360412 RepID=A0A0S7BGY8_9CHLR|nr:DUF3048 domain-containing protein [Longilinea arvoryzae]GAP13827.1 hypothetical protein LARV_01583 [Longilinea arvoryzae]
MAKKAALSLTILMLLGLAAACAPSATSLPPTPVATEAATPTAFLPATPTATPEVPTATATPAYPAEGVGPTSYPDGYDPLTGLKVADAKLLERRPIIVKVENLPRDDRPQWGLPQADLIYEYYTELGTTRFAAVYYGENTEKVGPIRSARHFDVNVIRAYKAWFIFGSAYEGVMTRLVNSEFASRLVLEGNYTCPAVCREDPNGKNYLVANLAEFEKVITTDNARPDLNGMFFQAQTPTGGQKADSVFARFSAAIYNRWDYDTASGRYLRFSDTENDFTGTNEKYAPLVDRANQKQIGVDNVVIILAPFEYLVKKADTEVLDVNMTGSGAAYIARDGQIFKVKWSRPAQDSVLTLTYEDGTPFPFKPGKTWFEVMGVTSSTEQTDTTARFKFGIP